MASYTRNNSASKENLVIITETNYRVKKMFFDPEFSGRTLKNFLISRYIACVQGYNRSND